jgi:acetoin utilization deacetylase AcuC-like enzyme
VRRVAFFDHPIFDEHDAGEGHPERPARLDALRRGLAEAGLDARLERRQPRAASREELLRVHTARHVDRVAASEGSVYRFDPDTQAGPRSYAAALHAAGAVVEAVDLALDGRTDRAFCAVRPPGHHAESDRAMGFCLFNNVAVGAAHALARGLERVLVIDWDVHHGNGTQEIFYADRRVLYLSSHAYPFYPGTGAVAEAGEGDGRGFTVNLPLPSGCGDSEYVALYRGVVEPIGRAFDPELVLVSVGFDPHAMDPLAGMNVTEAGFAALAGSCLAAARSARGAVFVLEGGYALPAIAASAAEVLRQILGEGGEARRIETTPVAERLTADYRRAFAPFWPDLA